MAQECSISFYDFDISATVSGNITTLNKGDMIVLAAGDDLTFTLNSVDRTADITTF